MRKKNRWWWSGSEEDRKKEVETKQKTEKTKRSRWNFEEERKKEK